METNFNKSADTKHKIALESSLVYAVWLSGTAQQGRDAFLEVGTSFVGFGAKIEIKAKSQKGKTLGSISDKIYNNKYVGRVHIADEAEIGDMAYFEVKISGLGLQAESERIMIVPAIKVSNMQWSASEARRGEVLTLKADVKNANEGVPAKVIIMEMDQDGAHDRICQIDTTVRNGKIQLDWEYEYHEDTDEIPTQQELDRYGRNYNPPEYFFVIEIDKQEFGTEQESGILTFKDWVALELRDESGCVIRDTDYVLRLADGSERRGRLDENGYAREDDIPPGELMIEIAGLESLRLRE